MESKAPAGDDLAGALGHLRTSAPSDGRKVNSIAFFRNGEGYYPASFRIMRGDRGS